MMRSGGFLAGGNLYLFSDESYYSTEWSDVSPEAASSKGRWSATGDLVILQPERAAPAASELGDIHLFAFCLENHDRRALRLIGLDAQIGELESAEKRGAGDADEHLFRLLMHSRERREDYSALQSSQSAKAQLILRLAASEHSEHRRPH